MLVKAFGDNDKSKWGVQIDGVPILGPDDLLEQFRNAHVVVASLLAENELFHQLKRRGFTNVYPLSYLHYLRPDVFEAPYLDGLFESCFDPALESVIAAGDALWQDEESKLVYRQTLEYRRTKSMEIYPRLIANHAQYFPPGIVNLSREDTLLDCGAFSGDTLRSFVGLNPNARNTYYGFEPDPHNFTSLQRESERYAGRLVAVNAGVGAEEGSLGFVSRAGTDSAFTTVKADRTVHVHTIDHYFADKTAPTFIKMDIEGMEPQALAGGEQVIRRRRPKLAICVYHLPQHIWGVPLMARTWNPDYRFYLRHYSTNMSETVMYAI